MTFFCTPRTAAYIQRRAEYAGAIKESFYDALIGAIRKKYTPKESKARAERIRSYRDWLQIVSPTYRWDWPHLSYVFDHLEGMLEGRFANLMIFMPPRHGKTEGVTIRFPVYLLERNPSLRVIIGSYNQTLASKFGRKCRRIASERMALSDERAAADDWETLEGGGVRSVGVGAGITGMGGDWIIIDDPIKSREEAESEAYRQRVWDWYRDDLYTRREPGARMILIQTRWHEDDLAGRIMASEDAESWKVVNLPALAEPDDPLGRAEGEALCPDRYTREDLLRIKTVLGASFSALFQGRPVAMEGGIFKRAWWRFYRELPSPVRTIQVWDTAFKKGQENDPSGGHTWAECADGYYLLDRYNGRLEYPELRRKVKTWYERWRPNAVLIEDAASGQSLIQDLRLDTTIPILPVKVDRDKEARAHSVTPFVEAGKCFLPEGAPWVDDFVDQMANFPNAAHDEDVDCFSHAIGYLTRVAGRAFDGCLD